MLNKIHEFVCDMQMGALLCIPIMAALYILLGIVCVITGVIDKKSKLRS